MTMTDLAVAETVHTATMHRDDAPIGRVARSHLRKRFGALSCCRRSWSDDGKHLFLHGFELAFDIEFACAGTEPALDWQAPRCDGSSATPP